MRLRSSNATPLGAAAAGFAILAFAMGVGRFAFTPLLPAMQADGLLTVEDGGALASIHYVGYVMGAVLAGRLRMRPQALLAGAILVVGLSTAAMGVTHDFALWAAARWAAGVASAVSLVVLSAHVLPVLAAAGRADLQGVVFSGVGVGTALVGLVMLALMAAEAPSAVGWIVFGAPTVLAAAALALAPNPAAPGATRPPPHPTTAKPRRRFGAAWRLTLPYGVMGGGYIVPATYLPIMAKQSVADPLVFGWSWPIFGLAAALSTVIAARRLGHLGNRRLWIRCQLIMAAGLVAPAVWPSLGTVILAGVAVGGTFVVITMAGLKEAHRTAPPGETQARLAAMTTAFAVGQILGPVAAGWAFAATGGFGAPLLVAAALLAASLAPLAFRSDAEPA